MAGSRNNPAADPLLSVRQLASKLLATLPESAPLDAKDLLENFPELNECKSVVLDLAYEEFCRQAEASSALKPQEFAARFPTIQHSLLRLLEFDQLLQNDSQLYSRFVNLSWPDVGTNFLGFQLVEELGRGSFSRVFLARETQLGGRPVVAKVCRRGIEEAHFLGQLDHPHIVPVHSVQTDDETGLTVICMPYLSRATLCDVLDAAFADGKPQQAGSVVLDAIRLANGDNVPLPRKTHSRLENCTYVEAVTRIGWELADALVFTHDLGICHSDIKPSNVLLSPTGTAMLFDFNLSFEDSGGALSLGGTLPYMAPEQLALVIDSNAPDEPESDAVRKTFHASGDVYSLGVTLFELLTGQLPFGERPDSKSIQQTSRDLYAARQTAVPSVRQANSQVSRPLAAVIEKCLAFAPEDRFLSAADLADELHALLPNRLQSERAVSPLRRIGRPLKIVSTTAALAAAAFVASNSAPEQRSDSARLAHPPQHSSDHPDASDQSPHETIDVDPDAQFRQISAALDTIAPDEAYRLLSEIAGGTNDHRVRASMAYALCRAGNRYSQAITESSTAIELGNDSAAVYNNLGFCYLRTGQFEKAAEILREARARDNSQQQISVNLALAILQASLRIPHATEASRLLEEGRELIRHAITAGPDHPEMHLIAARLNAASAKRAVAASDDPTPWVSATLKHCELAFQGGEQPDRIASVAGFYLPLNQSPAFTSISSRPTPEVPADAFSFCINPIESMSLDQPPHSVLAPGG